MGARGRGCACVTSCRSAAGARSARRTSPTLSRSPLPVRAEQAWVRLSRPPDLGGAVPGRSLDVADPEASLNVLLAGQHQDGDAAQRLARDHLLQRLYSDSLSSVEPMTQRTPWPSAWSLYHKDCSSSCPLLSRTAGGEPFQRPQCRCLDPRWW